MRAQVAVGAVPPRIAELVGVDIHEPQQALPWIDDFVIADLCCRMTWTPREPFDLVLSNFTIEHFAEPDVALSNFRAWLRPGGMLVVTTVNRRHPFVKHSDGQRSSTRSRRASVSVHADARMRGATRTSCSRA